MEESESITLLSIYGHEKEVEEAISPPPEIGGDGENANELPNEAPQSLTSVSLLDAWKGSRSSPRSNSPHQLQVPRFEDEQCSPSISTIKLTPAKVPESSIQGAADIGRAIGRAVVDLANDEAAIILESEAVEARTACMVLESQSSDGILEETLQLASVASMPNNQHEHLQPSTLLEQFKSETSLVMGSCFTEHGEHVVGVSAAFSSVMHRFDHLEKFLPPPVAIKCPEELQEKINKFLAYKRVGKNFNADLRDRKDYRNPDFLLHAVRYQDIDQIGTCFSKEIFDPHGYDKSDYYDEIEADMKRELKRKEQERRTSQKIDFVSGGTYYGIVAPALSLNAQFPGIRAANSLQTSLSAVDATRDVRQKSKWDEGWKLE
ncbi:hypothetical protein HPP92_009774 [Vanilla planifolia]|uniref:Uncharacterized protein n=1 Tax=Vanilla planifolia TaxID=51239 RepID=A0A835REW8_VANPL|nr:hypothetical protein HPP92_009774 [Vanilla planifolia]